MPSTTESSFPGYDEGERAFNDVAILNNGTPPADGILAIRQRWQPNDQRGVVGIMEIDAPVSGVHLALASIEDLEPASASVQFCAEPQRHPSGRLPHHRPVGRLGLDQLLGGTAALVLFRWLVPEPPR